MRTLVPEGDSTIKNPRVSEGGSERLQRKNIGFNFAPLPDVYAAYTGLNPPPYPLSLRAQNFEGSVIIDIDSDKAYLVTAMAMIPAAYGCVHVGALSLIFPSSIERLLWKISCYYLITAAVVSGILGLFTYVNRKVYVEWGVDILWNIVKMLEDCWDTIFRHGKWSRRLGIGITSTPLFSIALVYIIVRLYIVVESFISLRHVPVGVYETPTVNFMNYIPHL